MKDNGDVNVLLMEKCADEVTKSGLKIKTGLWICATMWEEVACKQSKHPQAVLWFRA